MKKFLLFALFGIMVLGLASCSLRKDDTCCVVNIGIKSNTEISSVRMETPKGKTTELGKFPGKYYIPYGNTVEVGFKFTYTKSYRDGDTYEETNYGSVSFNVGQAKELDVVCGSDYKFSFDNYPTACYWIGENQHFD